MLKKDLSAPRRHPAPEPARAPSTTVPGHPFLSPDLIQGALLVVAAELVFASNDAGIRMVAQEMLNTGRGHLADRTPVRLVDMPASF